MLLHTVEKTVCGLANVERNGEVGAEAEPFVIKQKPDSAAARPRKLDLAIASFVAKVSGGLRSTKSSTRRLRWVERRFESDGCVIEQDRGVSEP